MSKPAVRRVPGLWALVQQPFPQKRTGALCKIARDRICALWPDETVIVYRNGTKSENLSGDLLKLPTTKGDDIVLVPAGTKPGRVKIVFP